MITSYGRITQSIYLSILCYYEVLNISNANRPLLVNSLVVPYLYSFLFFFLIIRKAHKFAFLPTWTNHLMIKNWQAYRLRIDLFGIWWNNEPIKMMTKLWKKKPVQYDPALTPWTVLFSLGMLFPWRFIQHREISTCFHLQAGESSRSSER